MWVRRGHFFEAEEKRGRGHWAASTKIEFDDIQHTFQSSFPGGKKDWLWAEDPQTAPFSTQASTVSLNEGLEDMLEWPLWHNH